MTAISKQRLYKFGGSATVAISTALLASPFILVAVFLIELAARQG